MKYIIILLMAMSMSAKEYIETDSHYTTYDTFTPEVNDSYDIVMNIRLAMPKQHTGAAAMLIINTYGLISPTELPIVLIFEDESLLYPIAMSGAKKDGTFFIPIANKDIWMLMCKKIITISFMYKDKQYILYFDQQKRNKIQYTLHNLFIDNWK